MKVTKGNSYTYGIIILSISAAMLLTLAFPPLNFFPIAFIALFPLNIIIYKADKIRYYVLSSFLFVIVFFGYLLVWVAAFMLKETEAAVSFLALFTILFLLTLLFYFPAMIISGYLSKTFPNIRFLIVPAVFTVMEYMRNVGYLGFPWGIIGYSQWNFIPFIQIADTIGVLGISFLIYLSNAVITHYLILYVEKSESIKNNKKISNKKVFLPAIATAAVFFIVLVYGLIKVNYIEAKRVSMPKTKMALIQKSFDPNIPWNSIYTGEPYKRNSPGIQGLAERFLLKSEKFQSEEKPDGYTQNSTISVKRICKLATDAALSKPSLIVYPESVTMDSYNYYLSRYGEMFQYGMASNSTYPAIFNTYILYNTIKNTQTHHLLGTTIVEENTNENAYNPYKYYNGIEFINEQGNIIDSYKKIKLVPGGEAYPFQNNKFLLINTFPFKNIIALIYEQFDKAGASRWEIGDKISVFEHPNGYKFSGIICYESAFGDFVRQFAYDGAQTIAVITEDAWSYSDNSLLQHFYMSVFRAIENRRDIVHNGNSGVTGHISSSGKVISTLPFWKPDYMIANVALNDKITIYTRFGEWFVVLCFIGIVALFIIKLSNTIKNIYIKIKDKVYTKIKKTKTKTDKKDFKHTDNEKHIYDIKKKEENNQSIFDQSTSEIFNTLSEIIEEDEKNNK